MRDTMTTLYRSRSMRDPKERPTALVLALLLGAATASSAATQVPEGQRQQPQGDPAEDLIKQHDTDGDGKISQAEAVAPAGVRF